MNLFAPDLIRSFLIGFGVTALLLAVGILPELL
jgi:hypothetical protein